MLRPKSLLPSELIGPMAAALDRAVTLAVTKHHELGTTRLDDERLMANAAHAVSYFAGVDPNTYFPEPCRIEPLASDVSKSGPLTLSWPSTHRAICPEVLARYSAALENSRAAARLFVGQRPRPVAVLIHGYMGGAFSLEQRIWPIAWLDALGFDSALFTLPFHGLRADPERRAPAFPQGDILFNAEGFRQAVGDLRDLVHWLYDRGHPHVGLLGMSLGGYVAALTATLEPRLSFLVPIVPLACLAEFAREQGRMPRGSARALAYEQSLKQAYRLVSPLFRPPRIARERVLVVAGKADRITPATHARALARHFSAPLEAWSGGHLLQFGRAKSLQRVGTFLRSAAS